MARARGLGHDRGMRALGLGLLLGLGACAGGGGLGADPPYRFRQSLLEPELGPGSSRPRPSPPPGPSHEPARCHALVGRALASELELVRRCTGVKLAAPPAAGATRRAEPELLDLALFRGAPSGVRLGVVVARAGSRVEFVYLRGGKVRAGLLNLEQPHRRRLPGSARVENSYLREIQRGDPPTTRYLAGELLEAFLAPASL